MRKRYCSLYFDIDPYEFEMALDDLNMSYTDIAQEIGMPSSIIHSARKNKKLGDKWVYRLERELNVKKELYITSDNPKPLGRLGKKHHAQTKNTYTDIEKKELTHTDIGVLMDKLITATNNSIVSELKEIKEELRALNEKWST